MENLKNFIWLFVTVACTSSKQLPSTFMKCNRKQSDFNQCLTKAVEISIKQLNKPMNEIGLPNLEPLEIPSLTIGSGTNAVAVDQHYKYVKLFGISRSNCSKVDMNFGNKTFTLTCFSPEIRAEFEYEVNGKILLLPIYGTGPGTIYLDKVKYIATLMLEEYDKKSKKYFRVTDSKFEMEPELIRIKLENLFGGDKALGDVINNVLNENWKALFDEIKSSYEQAFAQILLRISNNFFGKMSISEVFGEE